MADDVAPEHVAAGVLGALFRAAESGDRELPRSILRPDAFVLTPTADGVLTSADLVIEDLRRWFDGVAARDATLRLRSERPVVGASGSGRAIWAFAQVVAEVVRAGTVTCSVPIRLTALLARDQDWRIAAAYWSVPFPTQDEQDAVKRAGQLEPGRILDEAIDRDAESFVGALCAALAEPRLIPPLYSTRDDHVTIGSVVDEVFLGGAARAAWTEFVLHVTSFVPRGPMRAALVAPDAGWLAANIGVGQPPTPYRFFYIWIQEESEWRIAVSHDAVSRDPLDAGF